MKPHSQGFEAAAIAIFVGMVLDGLDGRIARLTNTQSEFGAQYDSLSDMVCFGVAPTLVIYEWALQDLGKLGWIAAFIYCAGAALRLARFNTNIDIVDKRFFQGLPSPAAAALIAGLVWVSIDNNFAATREEMPSWLRSVACVLTLIAGISMVSNLPYWSGKTINLRKSVPFIFVIAVVLAFALGATYPPGVFFGLFVAYALSGYVLAFARWWRRRNAEIKAREETGTETEPASQAESLEETPRDTEEPLPESAPYDVEKHVAETESPLQGMEDVFAEKEAIPHGVKKALAETELDSYDVEKVLAETESALAMLAKSLAAAESPRHDARTPIPPINRARRSEAPANHDGLPDNTPTETSPVRKKRSVVKRAESGNEQNPKDSPA
jgi:CDP-diacylglycerol--serine O-phosphatidyltransferase